ncbi:MAG: hypothetical protein ACRENI_01485 [Gemmatimonadaceae bacterium]
MRRTGVLILMAALAVACKSVAVTDEGPAHVEPASTSFWGDWVLATAPDSTAFVGASMVEMTLTPSAFLIRATYPAREPAVVSGQVTLTETGRLTFIPARTTAASGMRGAALAFVPGEPLTMLASAAGGTLVFAPDASTFVPSSVWNRRAQAAEAGRVPDTTSQQ